MPDLWDTWSQGSYVYVANPRFMRLMSALWHETAMNLSPLARGRLKIFLVNDTYLQTHPKVCVVNVVNPHNVRNKPNDLRYVDTARTSSSVSRTSIFGILAIWSANNTFHILTRMSGHANQAVHIYRSSTRPPIDMKTYCVKQQILVIQWVMNTWLCSIELLSAQCRHYI